MKNKKHKHLFKKWAGGTMLEPESEFDKKYPCDDQYECSCGKKIEVRSNLEVHFLLPEVLPERDY